MEKDAQMKDRLSRVAPQWIKADVEVGKPTDDVGVTLRAIARFEEVWGANELSAMFRTLLNKRGVSIYDRKLEHHFTGSVMVINFKTRKVLLTFHPYYQIWQQLGGHDEGENDPLAVAAREAAEESGIGELWVSDVPVRIDPHPAYQCRSVKGEHRNYHYDICYMAVAATETFEISDESEDMKWFSVDELQQLVSEGKAQQRALEMAENSLLLLETLTETGNLPLQ